VRIDSPTTSIYHREIVVITLIYRNPHLLVGVIRADADGVVAVMILGSAYREHLLRMYTHMHIRDLLPTKSIPISMPQRRIHRT